MGERSNAYIKYLLGFYDGQVQGLRPKDVRPNSSAEITGSDEPSYLDDLVDIIEKLKYLG